jgi:acetyltransferase-like isoleucine patch superfamily enzyme
VTIGNDSIIGHLVMIEADTQIGEHVTIQSQCHITKFAFIDDHVFFGPMAMCINTKQISHGRDFKPKLEGPRFGYGARIGAGAIILPGTRIGANASIGAGALVSGKIPENELWYSKKMKAVFSKKMSGKEILSK